MNCGICGGGVRLYEGTLHGRPIKDWKHTDVPEGTTPHRPVLGRPVDIETLDRIHRPEEEPVAYTPPITYETQPLAREGLPPPAERLLTLGEDHGWELLLSTLTRLSTGFERVGLAMRRHDLGMVGFWDLKVGSTWRFGEGYSLDVGAGVRERVGSKSLKEWIELPEKICPVCNRSDIVTDHEECAP